MPALSKANPHVETVVERYIKLASFRSESDKHKQSSALRVWTYANISSDVPEGGRPLGAIPVKRLSMAHCEQAIRYFYDVRELKASTIDTYATTFRRFLRWAGAARYVDFGTEAICSAKAIREVKKRPTCISDEDYIKVLETIPELATPTYTCDEFELVLRLCGDMGLRAAEAYYLTWDEVCLEDENPYIALVNTERRRLKTYERFVPITGRVYALLQRAMPEQPTVIRRASHVDAHHESKSRPWRHLNERVQRISGTNVTLQKLRHRLPTKWAKGAKTVEDLRQIARVMGHASFKTTEKYYVQEERVKRIPVVEVA